MNRFAIEIHFLLHNLATEIQQASQRKLCPQILVIQERQLLRRLVAVFQMLAELALELLPRHSKLLAS